MFTKRPEASLGDFDLKRAHQRVVELSRSLGYCRPDILGDLSEEEVAVYSVSGIAIYDKDSLASYSEGLLREYILDKATIAVLRVEHLQVVAQMVGNTVKFTEFDQFSLVASVTVAYPKGSDLLLAVKDNTIYMIEGDGSYTTVRRNGGIDLVASQSSPRTKATVLGDLVILITEGVNDCEVTVCSSGKEDKVILTVDKHSLAARNYEQLFVAISKYIDDNTVSFSFSAKSRFEVTNDKYSRLNLDKYREQAVRAFISNAKFDEASVVSLRTCRAGELTSEIHKEVRNNEPKDVKTVYDGQLYHIVDSFTTKERDTITVAFYMSLLGRITVLIKATDSSNNKVIYRTFETDEDDDVYFNYCQLRETLFFTVRSNGASYLFRKGETGEYSLFRSINSRVYMPFKSAILLVDYEEDSATVSDMFTDYVYKVHYGDNFEQDLSKLVDIFSSGLLLNKYLENKGLIKNRKAELVAVLAERLDAYSLFKLVSIKLIDSDLKAILLPILAEAFSEEELEKHYLNVTNPSFRI